MGDRVPVRGVLANLWSTNQAWANGRVWVPARWQTRVYIAHSRPQRGLNRGWPRTELKKPNAFNEGRGRGSPPHQWA
jgi:hypothetical protein